MYWVATVYVKVLDVDFNLKLHHRVEEAAGLVAESDVYAPAGLACSLQHHANSNTKQNKPDTNRAWTFNQMTKAQRVLPNTLRLGAVERVASCGHPLSYTFF